MTPELLSEQMMSDGAFGLALLLTTVLLLGLTRRRRYPHAVAWVLCLGYLLAVSLLPSLRALDATQPGIYSLRGVAAGLALGSMLRLGRVTPPSA